MTGHVYPIRFLATMDALTHIGRIRVDELVGVGGMGEVFRGFDPLLERNATSWFDKALQTFRRLRSPRDEGMALNNLGLVARDRELRMRYFEQALERARQAGDRTLQGTVMTNLMFEATKQRDFKRAEAIGKEVLALHRDAGEKLGEVLALTNLGDVYFSAARLNEARAALVEAHTGARQIAEKRLIVHTASSLTLILSRQGHPAQARSYAEQARAICRELEDPSACAYAAANESCWHVRTGRLADAAAALSRAEALKRSLASDAARARYEYERGDYRAAAERMERAKATNDEWPPELETWLVTMRKAAEVRQRLPLPGESAVAN